MESLSELLGLGFRLSSSIDDGVGTAPGEQHKKIRAFEVMKMESMRLLQGSLLDRSLTCLLRLTMVSGQLLGSTTRRLKVSRCIGTTSGEHYKILRLHRKIQLVLYEH